jgi:hypothetical protein
MSKISALDWLFAPPHRLGRVLSLFSSGWNWDSPSPSPTRECAPLPPFGSGGRSTLAGKERGGGRVPIPTRGHTLWYSLYVCNLCPTPTAPFRSGSFYKHPERVHLLPPPEVTRLRSLGHAPLLPPSSASLLAKLTGRRGSSGRGEAHSPIRKLPLPEIFYHNAELEERAVDSDSSLR